MYDFKKTTLDYSPAKFTAASEAAYENNGLYSFNVFLQNKDECAKKCDIEFDNMSNQKAYILYIEAYFRDMYRLLDNPN